MSKATIESLRNLQTFGEGKPLPYDASFSMSDFSRIQLGLVPQQMEDKWSVYFTDPYLYFHRSWTGKPVFRIKLEPAAEGVKVTEALWSREFAKDQDDEREYQGRLLHFLISNLLLGRAEPFPLPLGASPGNASVTQHTISGTAHKTGVSE